MGTDSPEAGQVTGNRVTLNHPDAAAVRDAFERLPKRGRIEALCRWQDRIELGLALSEVGAFAIHMRPLADFREVVVTALKGKAGACFETGRSATYAGAASAVMDDDHHLIVGTIRVCEKTGGLYTLPPYHGLLVVTPGDPGLLERLETDPVPFACDTFERDAERLAAGAFSASSASGDAMAAVYYPGPFSLMVLRDGSILRRGRCAQIAARLVEDLRDRDGLLLAPAHRAPEADPPINYPEAYRGSGAGCLLDAAPVPAADAAFERDACLGAPLPARALDALGGISGTLRRRLLRLIEAGEHYCILTGSDPNDPLGCCPSTQVGEANRLVDAGILCCHRERAAAGSCTTALYAIAGEIRVRDNRPQFAIDVANRRLVAAALSRGEWVPQWLTGDIERPAGAQIPRRYTLGRLAPREHMRPVAVLAPETAGHHLAELPRQLSEAGFDVCLVPNLYHVAEDDAVWHEIARIEGEAAFLLPLYPRPIEALLRRHGAWREGRLAVDLRAWEAAGALVAELGARLGVPVGHGSIRRLYGVAGARWYPIVDEGRCTHCGSCFQFCLFGVYQMDDAKNVRIVHPDRCKPGCPACSRICPQGALMFPLYAKDPAIAGAPGLFPKPDAAARKMYYARTGLACPRCGQSGKPAPQPGAPAKGRDEFDALLDGLEELQEGRR